MSIKFTEQERVLASAIAKYKGRSSVIVSQLGIHQLAAKRIYKEVNGRPPPSGQLPCSTETNYQPIQRLQSSLLMIAYEKSLNRLKSINKTQHDIVENYLKDKSKISKSDYDKALDLVKKDKAQAFINAYSTYVRICGDMAKIDINRFDFLIKDLYVTSGLNTPRKIINWTKCRICKARILKKFDESNIKCPVCANSLERSRNLVGVFRERAVNRSLEI